LLADANDVTLSYRKETFSRLKPKNRKKLEEAIDSKLLDVILNSNVNAIEEDCVHLKIAGQEEELTIANQLVYIFAGGELPTQFLRNAGIEITTKFGEALLKHA